MTDTKRLVVLPTDGLTFFSLALVDCDDGTVSENSDFYNYESRELAVAAAKKMNDEDGGSFVVFECRAVNNIIEKKGVTVQAIKKLAVKEEAKPIATSISAGTCDKKGN